MRYDADVVLTELGSQLHALATEVLQVDIQVGSPDVRLPHFEVLALHASTHWKNGDVF